MCAMIQNWHGDDIEALVLNLPDAVPFFNTAPRVVVNPTHSIIFIATS